MRSHPCKLCASLKSESVNATIENEIVVADLRWVYRIHSCVGHNHSQNEGDRVAKCSQSHVCLICASQPRSIDVASSKKLQFSTLTAQDVVRISEFQVTHRDLYTTTDRAPVKDGVLDRRLVSLCLPLFVPSM